MLRLPAFSYHRPATAADAVRLAAEHGKEAMFVAGGTDLYPNMKRRHQTPTHVISLQNVPGLREVDVRQDGSVAIGAMVTLSALEHHAHLKRHFPAFAHAVREISTPLLRNMGTIGGNLLLDTRCTYYDQSHEWRESIDFLFAEHDDLSFVEVGPRQALTNLLSPRWHRAPRHHTDHPEGPEGGLHPLVEELADGPG